MRKGVVTVEELEWSCRERQRAASAGSRGGLQRIGRNAVVYSVCTWIVILVET